MTTPITTVVIEAVQWTPGRQPVLVQYSGLGVTSGPLATSQLHHATQAALAARAPEGVPDGYWSDAETVAELTDALTAAGFTVEVVLQEEPS